MTFQDGGSTTGTIEQEAPLLPLPEMAEATAPQKLRREGLPTRAMVIGSLVLALVVVGVALAIDSDARP